MNKQFFQHETSSLQNDFKRPKLENNIILKFFLTVE